MEYVSTRNDNETYTSEQVLNLGLAPDGGLFVPKEFPKFTHEEILSLKNKDFKSIAFIILEKFLLDLFTSSELKIMIEQAYENYNEFVT